MMVSNHIIIYIVVSILLFIPLLFVGIYKKIYQKITLKKLTQVFNIAFVFQLVIGVVLRSFYLKNIDGEYRFISNLINEMDILDLEMLISIIYVYIVIGVFIYFPLLLMLNIINFIFHFIKKENQ